MDAHKQLTIGLFGFGVVGEGLYKVLQQTPSLKASIKKVCIKNPGKKRNAPAELFTTDKNDLLNDSEINVIVEVINESEPAFEIVSTALKNGKDVVSASKKMIAEHLPELLQLQQETGRSFLCEAAACASIPVIRNLEEYYDNDLLHSIKAIVNGSTNFILTKMFEDKLDFREALLLAQQLGFAETDPKLDVEGYDAVNKWAFLLTHAYGIVQHPDKLVFNGIQNVQGGDAVVATEKHFDIKLVAQAKKLQNGKVAAFVLPQFVKHDDHLTFVKNEYNGVVIESGFADKQFFYGKGAGSFPTASAVLSDLSALRYQYRYEYKKLYHHTPLELTNDFYVRVYVSFDDWKYIPKERFEWIEEWHAETDRKYLVGVVAFNELRENKWWKENNTSLILAPEAIIEDVEIRKLKKKSLELAGII
ncbi:MAG: homoserine dehydrogenase [Candidatus Pseudobacter hemicellulosilyticus]|uniref:Homoserine dehydrogenase n=1 Tax=Candidatus Pseudobacter hemicellulosilyticus TaxID=3121375 RepID=A0AAJ6BG37_9BACT|nr:MAG: homoserine dehydrogenase [Pseudobacter sp.]